MRLSDIFFVLFEDIYAHEHKVVRTSVSWVSGNWFINEHS